MTVDLFGLPADYDGDQRRSPSNTASMSSTMPRRHSAPTSRAARSERSRPSPRPASFRQSRSAATATAARSSPMMTHSPIMIRSLRNHGQGTDRYDNVRVGMTGRLDTIQAAVLIEKLKIFPEEIAARERIARALQREARRRRTRAACLERASAASGRSTPIRVAGGRRDALAEALARARRPDRAILSRRPRIGRAPIGTIRLPMAASR